MMRLEFIALGYLIVNSSSEEHLDYADGNPRPKVFDIFGTGRPIRKVT